MVRWFVASALVPVTFGVDAAHRFRQDDDFATACRRHEIGDLLTD